MNTYAGLLQYLTFFSNALATPQGFILICASFFFIVFLLITDRGRWLGFSALLLAGIASLFENADESMGFHADFSGPTLAFLRLARPLVCTLLVVMSIRAVLQNRGWRRIHLGAAVLFLALLQILFASRLVFTDEPAKGILSILMTCFLYFGVYGLLTRSLQQIRDVGTIQKMVVLAGLAFAGISAVEYLHDPASVLAHQRFTGISGNPQFASIFLAIQCLTCVSMILSTDTSKRGRLLVILLLGVFGGLLLWTGSRTGALMVLVGVIVLVRSRLAKGISVLAVFALAFIVGTWLFPESLPVAARLFDSTNTRAENFELAYETFQAHPLFGDPHFTIIESSYLSTAAAMGLAGIILMGGAILAHLRNLYRVVRISRAVPELRNAADYVLVISFALATGALGEAFLLGYATASIVFVYITFALTQFVLDYGKEVSAAAVESPVEIPTLWQTRLQPAT